MKIENLRDDLDQYFAKYPLLKKSSPQSQDLQRKFRFSKFGYGDGIYTARTGKTPYL
jgi:hypothetical protein